MSGIDQVIDLTLQLPHMAEDMLSAWPLFTATALLLGAAHSRGICRRLDLDSQHRLVLIPVGAMMLGVLYLLLLVSTVFVVAEFFFFLLLLPLETVTGVVALTAYCYFKYVRWQHKGKLTQDRTRHLEEPVS